ncbi:MAG: glycosyltransferase [Gammaproteobacteria bacterium]|nr:glycosyltransferase [Gammaproteobacteria bacterium]
MSNPSLVVISSLFPSAVRPLAGSFVRERMFRVAQTLPVTVVSPQAWFPGQSLLRMRFSDYRLIGAPFEAMDGIEVYRPRALALPGVGRRWDGYAMARAALPVMRQLVAAGRCDIIDAHFAYPDGYAAALVGLWLKIPYCVTLRGTEPRHLGIPALRLRIMKALTGAARIFCVSNSLLEHALRAGADPARTLVVGNGVDPGVFYPVPRAAARVQLGIPQDAKVLITVGALVERKGFHRVLEHLPKLRQQHPKLHYLIVGGGSPEGDYSPRLRQLVHDLGLTDCVRFLGPVAPSELKVPLSASDVFVLPTSNEGWANVILEAMACGLPVIASDVGGNAEVIDAPGVGAVFPFGERTALYATVARALTTEWNAAFIIDYAKRNTWARRVEALVGAFSAVAQAPLNSSKEEANSPVIEHPRVPSQCP